jgi:hypothetical protein
MKLGQTELRVINGIVYTGGQEIPDETYVPVPRPKTIPKSKSKKMKFKPPKNGWFQGPETE